ncbi:sn1-specific diacylglycerol lipase alpha isoform X2 [Salmo trutta]|uniref:sn1-specific diacylglycerol lipase alpha isoform X2 n=1 Tax=Salmo trutta TaxID=8032 RepID=UPI001131BDA7|nr:sn1-specific diacylglycerol lipase alpha-like isoform X2 [Salmo trutta]
MPGMVMFRRRWSVGSDDLVLPALFLFLLHCVWLVVLSVVLFGLPYGSDQSCSVTLVDHGRGYLGILVSCLICESAIIWLSMRGSILYTQPREAVQYVIYIRLAILLVELVYAVVGIAWLFQYYQPCSDVTAKNLALGIVVCNWLVIFSVCFTLMCTFDPTGRTFVKLKATRRRQRNLTTYTLRHRLEEGQASSWSRRLKFFMCCTRAQDTQSDAYSEVASLFAEFFRDLDIVPSDIIAGLVLLRQRQRSNRGAILDQANNDILAFLSGMPVTRNTKYLDLKNSTEMGMYKEVCYYMLFALAAYGWPMYLIRKPACGLCRLASSCHCTSGSGSRLSQTVTVEEDNCCGCNVLAIRRHFLDRELKQVHVVYTSWHDAVYETPFFVAVDHGKKKVVISIRGTLSPKDALTDLTGDSERLPVEEQHGNWLGHKGMVYSAEYIKKKLEQEMILSQAFGRDLGKGTMHYGLVIVGHSLGAGTAAILSFLLRPQYPTLQCYSYSPPGGLLSEDAMEYSKEFVTSVVLGKDLVPRIGLSQLEGFRRHLLEVLQKSDKPKWRIIAGGTKCIPKSELPVDDGPQPQAAPVPPSTRLWLHPSDLSIALSASTPLYPPGKVIHVVHNHPSETCCGQEEPTYSALWGDNKSFNEVIISPAMLNEHMPHMVMEGLNKVLEPFGLSSEQAEAELMEDEDEGQPASTVVIITSETELPSTPLLSDTSSNAHKDSLSTSPLSDTSSNAHKDSLSTSPLSDTSSNAHKESLCFSPLSNASSDTHKYLSSPCSLSDCSSTARIELPSTLLTDTPSVPQTHSTPPIIGSLSPTEPSNTFPQIDQTSISHIDQPAVSHVDQPAISHVDQPVVSHVDQPSVSHVDQPVVSHVDQPVVSHVDQPVVSHVDQPAVSHVDQPAVSHVDQPHVDQPVVSHVDQPVVSHVDQPVVSHVDQPVVSHVDQPVVSHVDQPSVSHVDQPSVSHVDQPVVSHVDQPVVSHVDQPVVSHVDQPVVSHVDQPVVSHVDQPVVSHVDQPAVSHVDQPAVSHVDQPAVSHVDQPAVSHVDQPAVSHVDQPSVSDVDQPVVSQLLNGTSTQETDLFSTPLCHTHSLSLKHQVLPQTDLPFPPQS